MAATRRRLLTQALVAAALPCAGPSHAAAEATFPSRPVRLVIGFAPGGPMDIMARVAGQWLSTRLGQPFGVESRPGAGSNLGTETVVRATPAFDYPQLEHSAISTPSSMSARRDSPRQRTTMPGGGSRERPR